MQDKPSAVDFPTQTRAHIALACHDLDQSLAFYRRLLGSEPTKLREGYAKFELTEPPLNLSLNRAARPAAQLAPAHFGIQVKSTQAVRDRSDAMQRAGFVGRAEDDVGCCYAIQDKVWFSDPDGHQWEVFVVTEADIAEHSRDPIPAATTRADAPAADARSEDFEAGACCPPTCCA